jgi:ATP-binding cassette subfamily F protein 3
MLLHPSNFLLLDEPTNHLDMRAKDVLLESLEKFTGTVVFVSHDRYFIDQLATRVFEIGEGEVRVFPGNYEDYLWRKGGGEVDLTLSLAPAPAVNGHVTAKPEPAVPVKRVNPIKLRQMQERCKELEEEVAHLETQIAAGEAELGNFVSTEETIRVNGRVEKQRAELAAMVAEWEELSQAIESA